MHAMLLFGVLLVAVAVLLLVRRRQPTGTGRLARGGALVDGLAGRTLLGMGVVLLLAAPFEASRAWFGFGFPRVCQAKPEAEVDDPGSLPDPDQALQAEAQQDQLDADQPASVLEVGDTEVLQQLTGPGITTDPGGVFGTDLGHPFVLDGRLGLIFGDTFGDGDRGGWRSNVLAWASFDGPDDLVLEEWRTNGEGGGRASELLGSIKLNGWEQTVIPTNATTVGGDLVVHHMSVQCWGPHGAWVVNGAGLAVSRDGGRTFHDVAPRAFARDSGFAQVAFVGEGDVRHVLGIPAGRDGPARLARVDAERLTDVSAWEFWDGRSWSPHERDAVPVVPAPVGELSVRWNEALDTWVLMHLHEVRGAIVLRTADALTGPWSAPVTVVTGADIPELYAPYLLPSPTAEAPGDTEATGDGTGEGTVLRYTLSRFDIYNVLHVRTAVTRADSVPSDR